MKATIRLRRRLVLLLVAVSVLSGVQATSAPPAQAVPGSYIVAYWHDANGYRVILRNGTYNFGTGAGFGWTKIKFRHNILSTATIRYVVKTPYGPTRQGAQNVYVAYANMRVCSNGRCRVTQSVKVKVIVSRTSVTSYYGVTVNGVLGVQTAYCVTGYTWCPTWVDWALGARGTPTAYLDGVTPSGSPPLYLEDGVTESTSSDGGGTVSSTGSWGNATTDAGYSSTLELQIPDGAGIDLAAGETASLVMSYQPLDPNYVEPFEPLPPSDGSAGPAPDDGT